VYPAEIEHSTDTEQCANCGDGTGADAQNDKKGLIHYDWGENDLVTNRHVTVYYNQWAQ
jgi:hypothetical protein